MANKDRNKRSARKARAAERTEREAAQQPSASATESKPEVAKAAPKPAVKKTSDKKKNGIVARVKTFFSDVRTEMHRVVWPSKDELKNYSVAVLGMLLVFGVAVWLVDTGVVSLLVGYAGLRG